MMAGFITSRYFTSFLILNVLFASSSAYEDLYLRLKTYARDGLGVEAYQHFLDTKVTFTKSSAENSQQEKLLQIANIMKEKYAARVAGVLNLAELIKEAYQSNNLTTDQIYQPCCNFQPDEWDFRLGMLVDTNELCLAGNNLVANFTLHHIPRTVLSAMKEFYGKIEELLYVYYTSEEGLIYNYPAIDFCSSDYDPRFRPFYVEAVTPRAKDLVIIIDTSSSMNKIHNGRTLMQIASEVATTVIDTAGPDDRLGVVAFSFSVSTPTGSQETDYCFQRILAKGTSDNRQVLKDFIKELHPEGLAYYNKALAKALQYFDETPEDKFYKEKRDKAIIFLTDGSPTDSADLINRELDKLNQAFDNSVVIFTYGLGGEIDQNSKDILQNMADKTQGIMTLVDDPDDLRFSIGTYYSFYVSEQDNTSLTFTVPYQDAFGSGLIVSMCEAVRVNGVLQGAICADQALEDIVSELEFLQLGELSYSYVVDATTRVLYHPLVQNPTTINNDPRFTYLETLEVGDGVQEMLNSIQREEPGNTTLVTRLIRSRGDPNRPDVDYEGMQSQYYWNPVPNTIYILGHRVIEGDTQVTIQSDPSLLPSENDFKYHRLDLLQPSDEPDICTYLNSTSLKDVGSAFFSLRCFTDPFFQRYVQEGLNNRIPQMYAYLTSSGTTNIFKAQVKESLASSIKFLQWLSSNGDMYEKYSMWRYLALESGIFLSWPANQYPKNYDAQDRGWYVTAKAFPGKVILTPPYQDVLGAETILTLSTTIFEGKPDQQHGEDDVIIGVTGADFTIDYFSVLLKETVSECSTSPCIVIDHSGYVVFHPSWLEDFEQAEPLGAHIAQMEPDIAKDMINSGIMSESDCIDLKQVNGQLFWKVKLNRTQTTPEDHTFYTIKDVNGTNVFLIIRTSSPSSTSCESCLVDHIDIYEVGMCPVHEAIADTHPTCHCPCFTPNNVYMYCEAYYSISGLDTTPVCSQPPYPAFVRDSDVPPPMPGLPTCADYGCSSITDRSSCRSVVGCSWCFKYESGQGMQTGYCDARNSCPLPVPLPVNAEKAPIKVWIFAVAAVLGLLVVVAVVIAVLLYMRSKRKPSGCRIDSTYIDTVGSNKYGSEPRKSREEDDQYLDLDDLDTDKVAPPVNSCQHFSDTNSENAFDGFDNVDIESGYIGSIPAYDLPPGPMPDTYLGMLPANETPQNSLSGPDESNLRSSDNEEASTAGNFRTSDAFPDQFSEPVYTDTSLKSMFGDTVGEPQFV